MLKLILIAAGGAVGSLLRYATQVGIHRLIGNAFPLGTLVVNTVGCFAIGVVAGAVAGDFILKEEYRLGIMVGVLGGFTTFSAFGLETFALAHDGRLWPAALNIVASCGICLIAVAGGFRLGSQLA